MADAELLKGRYRIERELGRGGFGVVYLARDEQLHARQVVVKVLLNRDLDDAWVLKKFRGEVEALARIDHPSVVAALDTGQLPDGTPFLVMQHVNGITFRAAMTNGVLTLGVLAELVRQIGRGLAAAHALGVIHRDLKPPNVMIQQTGPGEWLAKIIDFGIATVRSGGKASADKTVIAGTIAYMAPEQLAGKPVAASDVYALGAMMYEALTGRLPFFPESPLELYALQREGVQRRPSELNRQLPASVDEVLLATLAFEADLRPGPAEFADALARALGARAEAPDHQAPVAAPAPVPGHDSEAPTIPPLPVLVARAFQALRDHRYPDVHRALDLAAALPEAAQREARGTIAQCRGAVLFHEGRSDLALRELNEALEIFGSEHFSSGRVLDSLGMVYSGRHDFHMARDLYLKAIEAKTKVDDQAGIALSHGQVARLYLSWGRLDEAEVHLRKDLQLSVQARDERSVAQTQNHLGQVALARGEWAEAAGWLQEAVARSNAGGWKASEGFARKDLALAHLGLGEVDAAAREAASAVAIFEDASFPEGQAHASWALGRVEGARERWDQAENALAAALTHFARTQESAESAGVQLDLARLWRARGASPVIVSRALREALLEAEHSRREALVAEVEKDLREMAPLDHCRHVSARSRGRGVTLDTSSLLRATREEASILFLDLQGSTEYARRTDPEELMMTINQMMLDFATALERHQALVTTYMSDGFMALLRGTDHPRRGVAAALELLSLLDEFNAPRRVLGLTQLAARVAVSTGEVCIGNVGTYRKMDFTAVGLTVALAARLQTEARPGMACISRRTFDRVREVYTCTPDSPRTVVLKGIGEEHVWDVAPVAHRS
jgi:class 3 adenylate cyclase/tRNA A-37 threonylcarbamoyl transferase component Bud32